MIRPLTIFLIVLLASHSRQTPATVTNNVQERFGLAIEAIFNIGLRLQALLEDPNTPNTKNFLVSPLSITVAVGQLMCGAEGTLQDQLYALMSLPETGVKETSLVHYYKNETQTYGVNYSKLHLQLSNLIQSLEENPSVNKMFILNIATALFVNRNIRLNDTFRYYMKLYQTDIQMMNFTTDPVGSLDHINNWAAENSNNLIKTILAEPLPRTAAGVFANSVYFKADWETPFSSEISRVGNFTVSSTKKVPVTYMQGEFYIPYAENDVCRMIALPYKNNELAMYIILPKEDNNQEYDIKSFVNRLTAKMVMEMKNNTRYRDVTLMLPKMKLSNKISVLDPLKKYTLFKKVRTEGRRRGSWTQQTTPDPLDVINKQIGRFNTFNKPIDNVEIKLTAASQDNFVVSNILQQMTLSVNEKGTEAAAITSSTIDYIGGSKIFRVERPFVFFISHEATSAALFWGTIVDPTLSQKLQ